MYMKLIIIIIIALQMLFASDKYKEPEYNILSSMGNIEIRQYGSYVVAKTSLDINQNEENNMFRTLASYIFGNNEKEESIAMTAPVTTYTDEQSQHMIFYMLDAENANELPNPNGQSIEFEEFYLGKCVVISFSWFTTQGRIDYYTNQLKKYISDNQLKVKPTYMLNRYDPPWKLPFLRRNEILVQIDEGA